MENHQAISQKFFSQGELADRWRVSAGTIINWRKKGLLSYIRLPGSVKLLYPENSVLEVEQNYLNPAKEVELKGRSHEQKAKKSEVAATYVREWKLQ